MTPERHAWIKAKCDRDARHPASELTLECLIAIEKLWDEIDELRAGKLKEKPE